MEFGWEITYAKLMQFTDDRVQGPADSILKDGGQRVFAPGDKACQFCPAKTFCAARAAWLMDDTPLEVVKHAQTPDLPPLEALSPDALSKVIVNAADIIKWIKGAQKYGAQMASQGTPLPGTKIVLSKGGHRVWSDPDEAKIMFLELVTQEKVDRDQVLREVLVTPKQAEEFEFDFGQEQWKQLQSLMFKPPGKPVLASVDDPRPAYTGDVNPDVFDEEDEV